MPQLTREKFLKLLAAGGASFLGFESMASAQESPRGPSVPWARLKFTGEGGDNEDWHVHPHGDLNLIDAVREETSLNLEKKWNVAEVSDLATMSPYPFLFMHAEISPTLNDAMRKNLSEYLLRGGFLFAEDCVNGYGRHGMNSLNDFFFQAMKMELPQLIPGSKFEQLPNNHPIFHCFYQLDGLPYLQGTQREHGLWGLTHEGRLLSVLSPTDLHCGWTNGDVWFGPEKRKAAMQMGTNIYLYAMTQAGAGKV